MDQPRPIEMLRPEVPAQVADVIYKMMAKKPADRFQTPAELANALGNLLKQSRIWHAAPPPKAVPVADQDRTQFRTDPFWQGIVAGVSSPAPSNATANRSWVIVGAAAVLIMVAGGLIAMNAFGRREGIKTTDQRATAPAKKPRREMAVPKAETPAEQAAPLPAPAQAISLLPLIDPALDAVAGKWSVNNAGELLSDNVPNARIRIPYRPPAEYDLRIAFTRRDGPDGMTQILVGGGKQFRCELGGYGNTLAHFELVDGKWGMNNRTAARKPAWLTTGRRHESVVQVRKDGVLAFLDGELATQLQSNFNGVSIIPTWDPVDPTVLGLGSYRSPMTSTVSKLSSLAGKASLLALSTWPLSKRHCSAIRRRRSTTSSMVVI
jgi:hypothetical protein